VKLAAGVGVAGTGDPHAAPVACVGLPSTPDREGNGLQVVSRTTGVIAPQQLSVPKKLAEIIEVGHVPFDCTAQEQAVQAWGAEMVTPPATVVSGVGHVPGHPSAGLAPFCRTMGPSHPVGTDGTQMPLQPVVQAPAPLPSQ
jgi:hypothetical protein